MLSSGCPPPRRGRDHPDLIGVPVEDHHLAVGLVLHNEPVLWGQARLAQSDLLLPGWFLAVFQLAPPFLSVKAVVE